MRAGVDTGDASHVQEAATLARKMQGSGPDREGAAIDLLMHTCQLVEDRKGGVTFFNG